MLPRHDRCPRMDRRLVVEPRDREGVREAIGSSGSTGVCACADDAAGQRVARRFGYRAILTVSLQWSRCVCRAAPRFMVEASNRIAQRPYTRNRPCILSGLTGEPRSRVQSVCLGE